MKSDEIQKLMKKLETLDRDELLLIMQTLLAEKWAEKKIQEIITPGIKKVQSFLDDLLKRLEDKNE